MSLDENSRGQTERLLLGSKDASALRHKLALIEIEGKHRALHRSHYDPSQPRVPSGNPDGGQWTKAAGDTDGRLAAADRPSIGPRSLLTIALRLAERMIQAHRSENGLWDLFGRKDGTVTVTTINGSNIFGSNSSSPTYSRADRVEAERFRDILIDKYSGVMKSDKVGEKPNDAMFHAEATALLRAARKNGGTLAGQTLEVFADRPMCASCRKVLPKLGLELGNPTVTFIDHAGLGLTMRDGRWSN
jgi:hypothetical protein